jgi:hypothetical protein
MKEVLTVIGLYLVFGAVFLAVFELTTHRVTRKLDDSAYETQNIMGGAGVPLRTRSAKIVILVVTYLFWPAVIVGMFTKGKPSSDKGDDSGKKS